jgi:hypothetical protein
MTRAWQRALIRQFEAAIETLAAAIAACPDRLWDDRSTPPPFWHIAYHTLFYLDLYLSESEEHFTPPACHRPHANFLGAMPFPPFDVETPAVVCTREELAAYLAHGRAKCRERIAGLADEEIEQPSPFPWLRFTRGDLLLYTMRHVQHHAAQLNLRLRAAGIEPPPWVGGAE